MQYFPCVCYRLDPFHLRRALREALETYAQVCRTIEAGDWAGVESMFRRALRGRHGSAQALLWGLRGYLRETWTGIVASGEAPRRRAIKAEVFHVPARGGGSGMSGWNERGADHVARLLSERFNSQWCSVLDGRHLQVSSSERRAKRKAVHQVVRQLQEDPACWLRARIPALVGPHADRPWVQVLRDLAHVGVPAA